MKSPVLAMVAVLCASCTPTLTGPAICSVTQPCQAPMSCVVGRCRKPQEAPVPVTAQRLQFRPVASAQLKGGVASPMREPVFISSEKNLLLRFAVELPAKSQLQSAWLELQPSPHCEARSARIELRLSNVLSPWQEPTRSQWLRPRVGAPMHAATAPSSGTHPLRVEITDVVHHWLREGDRFHGLQLSVGGVSDTEAPPLLCYASGLLSHTGPMLVLYLDTPEPPRAHEKKG